MCYTTETCINSVSLYLISCCSC